MASFVKYETFATDVANKVHDFSGSMDTWKIMLSNTAPNVTTHTVRTDVTELSTANGYTSGGQSVSAASSATGGTVTVTSTDVVWTAAGGSIGPFRYVILYNDTPTSPADPLVGYWDYGSSITLLTGETFTADFGASLLTLA